MTYRHYFLSDRRCGALLLRRNKRLFKHIVTGNKSGALLLTIFVLTLGATNEWFTKRRAESAVQDGDGRLTKLKHPAFNQTRASSCRRLECVSAHPGPLREIASQPVPVFARRLGDKERACVRLGAEELAWPS
jgi:hypothetical protein